MALTIGDKAVVISDRPMYKAGGASYATTGARNGDVIVITDVWGDGDLTFRNASLDSGGIISPEHVEPYVAPRKPRKPVDLPFTIEDKYGDDVTVFAGPARGRVYIETTDRDTKTQASLSPKQAKRVARALLAAAKEASA